MYIETAHGVHIKLVSLCVFFFAYQVHCPNAETSAENYEQIDG